MSTPRTLFDIQGDAAGRTLVMGILNVTPDSFFDGGAHVSVEAAVAHALQMQDDGADLIDIGGESTRPGSAPVSADVECSRILPVLKALRASSSIPISIDTTKACVAEEALQAGADWINDVTALEGDPDLASVVARHGATVVLMHMQGTPRTMQVSPAYGDVVAEVQQYLAARVQVALDAGINRDCILLDPGFGFGKAFSHNAELLRHLDIIEQIGYPVLVGMSRKSMIEHALGLAPAERLLPSVALATMAVWQGATVVRVHDVRETVQAVRMTDAIRRGAVAHG